MATAKGGPRPDPGATGQGKGADGSPRDLSKVPPQLLEHAHAPGSNGDVHRGPDLKPRNMFRALILKAFTDECEVQGPEKRSGAAQRKRARARYAAMLNTAKGIQNITLQAALGNVDAFGPLLRLIRDGHDILQPAKDEPRSPSGPIMPVFSPPAVPAASPAIASPTHPGEAAVIDQHGTPYVEAE